MMHVNVNVFPILAPLVKKMCKVFYGCFFYKKMMSLTSDWCSLLSFHIYVENNSYGKHPSTLLESIYVVNIFLNIYLLILCYFHILNRMVGFFNISKWQTFLWITCISNYFVWKNIFPSKYFVSFCVFVITNYVIHYYIHHFDWNYVQFFWGFFKHHFLN
jgi:hypothetical protein